MNRYWLLLPALLLSALAHAGELIVNVGGKDATIQSRVLDREIGEKDRNAGSQASPLDCSLLYYSLLAKGDIEAAAKLATDPAAATSEWNQYRERLGAADFRKEMAAYFTAKNRVIAALTHGDETMLLVKTPDYTAGQMYRLKDGKYFVVSGRRFSEASKVLGKALNLINEGKLKP